jgi:hypothetical protein
VERKLWYSLGVSLVGGVVTTCIATYCWGHIAAYTPVTRWLLGLELRGIGLTLALFPIDFLVNVSFFVPLALVLLKLQPQKLGLYLAVAIVPSFIWLNLPLLGNEVFYRLWPSFVPGWLHNLFALPVAAWVVGRFAKPSTPNKFMHATCEDARA